VVTNIALDYLRARKRWWKLFQRREDLMVDAPDMSDLTCKQSNAQLADIIKALTEELPLKQRTVLVLRDFQDLSTEEVAQIVGISVQSVKTNLHYARTHVRKLLEERFGIVRETP
jgi:RNA polymerase sigma-70 factor (ECF subfamily)